MIHIINGNDEYLIKQKVNELISSFNDATVINYDGKNVKFSILEVIDECNMQDLFNPYKIVIIDNPQFFSAKHSLDEIASKYMLDYSKNSNPCTELIFCGNFDIDKRKKFFKELSKHARYEEINKMDDRSFKAYMREYLKKHPLNIDTNALNSFINMMPNDLLLFHNEVEKLALYPEFIDGSVLNKLVNFPLEDNIFLLTNALVSKNIKQAFHTWNDLKIQRFEPIQIILITASQFRFMMQVRVLMNQGYNEDKIAKVLKAHPYRTKITMSNVAMTSSKKLLAILSSLAKLDQSVKKGQIDAKQGLEKFMIEVLK